MLNVPLVYRQHQQMITAKRNASCSPCAAFFFFFYKPQHHRMLNEAYANFTHDSFCFASNHFLLDLAWTWTVMTPTVSSHCVVVGLDLHVWNASLHTIKKQYLLNPSSNSELSAEDNVAVCVKPCRHSPGQTMTHLKLVGVFFFNLQSGKILQVFMSSFHNIYSWNCFKLEPDWSIIEPMSSSVIDLPQIYLYLSICCPICTYISKIQTIIQRTAFRVVYNYQIPGEL